MFKKSNSLKRALSVPWIHSCSSLKYAKKWYPDVEYYKQYAGPVLYPDWDVTGWKPKWNGM